MHVKVPGRYYTKHWVTSLNCVCLCKCVCVYLILFKKLEENN